MQAPPASKIRTFIARTGLRNLIWGAVFVGLLLSAAAAWLWPYRELPTSTWRDANSTLPWVKPSVTVEDVQASWRSSKGNARMELRAAYYPVAKVTLGESKGSGMLYVRFSDSQGQPMGDFLSLRYKDGEFLPRTESNIKAAGKTAELYVETGFGSKDEFTLHCINEHTPLWRVSVAYMTDGSNKSYWMGSVTIPAEEKGGEQ